MCPRDCECAILLLFYIYDVEREIFCLISNILLLSAVKREFAVNINRAVYFGDVVRGIVLAGQIVTAVVAVCLT